LVAPPGEARTDFDIFLALAEKLGVRRELFPG
jgi:assimilatory nitrate reductase catalytic subunit